MASENTIEEYASFLQDILDDSFNIKAGRSFGLQPRDFFVAFGGVICVAFDGFPILIEEFKATLEVVIEKGGKSVPNIHPQNMGSKWAKATLGAMEPVAGEDAKAPPLTLEMMAAIREVCLKFRKELRKLYICVPQMKVVEFANRSLTERVATKNLDCFPAKSNAFVSDAMQEKTSSIIGEFFSEDGAVFENYFKQGVEPKVQTMSHYTAEAHGKTLVMDLKNEKFGQLLDAFCAEVNEALEPFGVKYAWMPQDSLHCTVRGLQ